MEAISRGALRCPRPVWFASGVASNSIVWGCRCRSDRSQPCRPRRSSACRRNTGAKPAQRSAVSDSTTGFASDACRSYRAASAARNSGRCFQRARVRQPLPSRRAISTSVSRSRAHHAAARPSSSGVGGSPRCWQVFDSLIRASSSSWSTRGLARGPRSHRAVPRAAPVAVKVIHSTRERLLPGVSHYTDQKGCPTWPPRPRCRRMAPDGRVALSRPTIFRRIRLVHKDERHGARVGTPSLPLPRFCAKLPTTSRLRYAAHGINAAHACPIRHCGKELC